MKHTKADLSGAVAELVDLARTNGVSAKEIINALQPYNFTREELAQHYFIMEGDYTLPDLQELLYEVIKKHEETENDELLDLQYDIEETYVFLGGSLEDMADWNIDGKNFTQEDAEYTEPQELFDRAKELGL